MKYSTRIHEEMDLEVTWIHHWKKNGNSRTRTRPFRVRTVQGLSGLALPKVDPARRKEEVPQLGSIADTKTARLYKAWDWSVCCPSIIIKLEASEQGNMQNTGRSDMSVWC